MRDFVKHGSFDQPREWGVSETNRKARFYTLTRRGRRELTREQSEWRRIAAAIMRVLSSESA